MAQEILAGTLALFLYVAAGACNLGVYAGYGCEFAAGMSSCTPEPSNFNVSHCDTYVIGEGAHLAVGSLVAPRKGFVLRKGSSLKVSSTTNLLGSLLLGEESRMVVKGDLTLTGSLNSANVKLSNGALVVGVGAKLDATGDLTVSGSLTLEKKAIVQAANVILSHGRLALHSGASLSCQGERCRIEASSTDMSIWGALSCKACSLRSFSNLQIGAGGHVTAHLLQMHLEACGNLSIDGALISETSGILLRASFISGSGILKANDQRHVEVHYGALASQTPSMSAAKVGTYLLVGGQMQHLQEHQVYRYVAFDVCFDDDGSDSALGIIDGQTLNSCMVQCDANSGCHAFSFQSSGRCRLTSGFAGVRGLDVHSRWQCWAMPASQRQLASCPMDARHTSKPLTEHADFTSALLKLCKEHNRDDIVDTPCLAQLDEERVKKARDDNATRDAMDDLHSLYTTKAAEVEQLNESLKVESRKAHALQEQLAAAMMERDEILHEAQVAKEEARRKSLEVAAVVVEKDSALRESQANKDALDQNVEELTRAMAQRDAALRDLQVAKDDLQKKCQELGATTVDVDAEANSDTSKTIQSPKEYRGGYSKKTLDENVAGELPSQHLQEELAAANLQIQQLQRELRKTWPRGNLCGEKMHDVMSACETNLSAANSALWACETKAQTLSEQNNLWQNSWRQESQRSTQAEVDIHRLQGRLDACRGYENVGTATYPNSVAGFAAILSCIAVIGIFLFVRWQMQFGNRMQGLHEEVLALIKTECAQLDNKVHARDGNWHTKFAGIPTDGFNLNLQDLAHLLLTPNPQIGTAMRAMAHAGSTSYQPSEDNRSTASEGWQHVGNVDGPHPPTYRMDSGSTTSTDSGNVRKCFLPGTAFKNLEGYLCEADKLMPGFKVRSSNGSETTVMRIDRHLRKKYTVVELVTRHAHLKVSSDHPVKVPGQDGAPAETKQAEMLVEGEKVFVGEREQQLTRVKKSKESTELIGIVFDKDVAVEAFVIPSRGIQAYGEPHGDEATASVSHDSHHDDMHVQQFEGPGQNLTLSLLQEFSSFSEEDLLRAMPLDYQD